MILFSVHNNFLIHKNIKDMKLEKMKLEEKIDHLEERLKESKTQIKQKVCAIMFCKKWQLFAHLEIEIN